MFIYLFMTQNEWLSPSALIYDLNKHTVDEFMV